jgi:predicted amidohydrolase YtcJ
MGSKQRVLIQQAKDPMGLSYETRVFEVSLRKLESSWCVLEGFKELGLKNEKDKYPILHRGFFDAHLHAFWAGKESLALSLKEQKSAEEATKSILNFIKLNPNKSIYRAYGWDESRWSLSKEELCKKWDKELPADVPIILGRICGHSAWISGGLKGLIHRVDLASFVSEKIYFKVSEEIPGPNFSELKSCFLNMQERFISVGISAISEMSMSDEYVLALNQILEEGKLLLDVVGIMDAQRAPKTIAGGVFVKENAFQMGPSDRKAFFIGRHWKRFLDGSFGSHTAWLTKSYADKDTFGDSQEDTFELISQAKRALKEGFYLSFHVIGDAALDQALALGDALNLEMRSRCQNDGLQPLKPTRHRLEHVQLCRPEQLQKIRDQGFWSLAIQPSHRMIDDSFAAVRLGSQRLKTDAYRLASFNRMGIPIAISSDAPIADYNPAMSFEAQNFHNEIERLNPEDLIWKMTVGGRLALGLPVSPIELGSTVWLSEV